MLRTRDRLYSVRPMRGSTRPSRPLTFFGQRPRRGNSATLSPRRHAVIPLHSWEVCLQEMKRLRHWSSTLRSIRQTSTDVGEIAGAKVDKQFTHPHSFREKCVDTGQEPQSPAWLFHSRPANGLRDESRCCGEGSWNPTPKLTALSRPACPLRYGHPAECSRGLQVRAHDPKAERLTRHPRKFTIHSP